MAITSAVVGAGVALAGTGVGARENQLSRQQAEDSAADAQRAANKPVPVNPLGAESATANQVQSANLMSASAGGTLLGTGASGVGGSPMMGSTTAPGRTQLGA